MRNQTIEQVEKMPTLENPIANCLNTEIPILAVIVIIDIEMILLMLFI